MESDTVELQYRVLTPEDAPEASRLIGAAFEEFIAPDFTEEGKALFRHGMTPEEILDCTNRFYIGAFNGDALIGLTGLRDISHICLFTVRKDYHRQGIGRRLFELLAGSVKAVHPEVDRLTVHASNYAVPVYERLGFVLDQANQSEHGMVFNRMHWDFPHGA